MKMRMLCKTSCSLSEIVATGTLHLRACLGIFPFFVNLEPSGPLYSVLNKVGRLLQNSPNDVTVRVLDCLTELVRQPNLLTDLKQAVDQAQIKFDWIARVGQTTGADRDLEMSALNRTRSAASVLKRITNKATNPYSDIRLASLKAIHAFSTQVLFMRLPSFSPLL